MFNVSKKLELINAFWTWFDQNKYFLKNIEDDREDKLNAVMEELQKIDPGVSFEISSELDGVREIIISAEGDIDKFPIVKEIVAKAPKIEGWMPIAFRQPSNDDFTLEYEDLKLTPSKLFFVPVIEENALDILVIGEDFNQYDLDTLAHYGLIMLDNLMGEFNCVTKVRHYDFIDLDDFEEQESMIPLLRLNSFIDEFYMNNN